ncbi:MAG: site-2 protease family protein [Planctomycetes bacterium]|nr:site-2 protease family protein [Planctomycetota bacterium]MBM4080896.1 site-2 protease family protein [Planctomycetota bacterium]
MRILMLVLAVTIHEFCHAWVAYRCGDPTPRVTGRITLNPVAHFDPLGFLCMLFAPFGWGKPVMVNPLNFRHPRRDDVLVSAAGPLSNIAAALAFGILFRVGAHHGYLNTDFGHSLARLLLLGVQINLGLAFFNLIPLSPLDGSHVLQGLLPRDSARRFESFSRYGPATLLILIFFGGGLLNAVLGPPIRFFFGLFTGWGY